MRGPAADAGGVARGDPSGRFCSKRTLAARSVTGQLVLAEVEREIAAQIGFVRDQV